MPDTVEPVTERKTRRHSLQGPTRELPTRELPTREPPTREIPTREPSQRISKRRKAEEEENIKKAETRRNNGKNLTAKISNINKVMNANNILYDRHAWIHTPPINNIILPKTISPRLIKPLTQIAGRTKKKGNKTKKHRSRRR